MATSSDRKHLIKLVKSFSDGMLVTRSEDGLVHGRPMALTKVDEHGDIWFLTDLESHKLEEIEEDPNVCITLQAHGKYLSLAGTAEIVRDRAQIAELWSPMQRIFFPKGKDDPNLCALRIHTRAGEYWDVTGRERLKFAFEAVRALVRGKRLERWPRHQGFAAL